jgi:hypothetical protein
VRRPEAARLDVPADRLARRAAYRQALRPAYAAAAPSSDFQLQEGPPSGARPPEALPSEAPFAVSAPVPAWRREAGAGVSSAASAQPEPSSLPGAAAVGVAAYVRAVPPWAEPVGPDVQEQRAEAARAALGARAQPREAAVAAPDAELVVAAAEAAELDAALQPEVAGAAALDAALQPGEAEAAALDAGLQPEEEAAAVRDAVRRRGAAARPSAAAPSAFHRGQALPWLAP